MNRRFRSAAVALLMAGSGTFLTLTPAPAVADTSPIVVNEFAANQFVELRNVSDSTVDIGGFKMLLCDSGGVVGTPRVGFGAVLPPGGFWVVGSRSFTGGPVDQTYFGAFPGGGAALLDPNDAWVDGIAVVRGSPCGEGDPAPPCPQASTARDAASTDTGSNAVDFTCRVPSPGDVN